MPPESLVDAIVGGLLGAAAGDALGATVEFMSPADIERRHGVHRDIVGGGAFGWRPGQGTDDTDLTWAVVSGYLNTEGIDSLQAIAEEFLAWFDTDPPDVGLTTREALRHLRRDGDPATSGLTSEHSTTCAIAGGLLGATHGAGATPSRWRGALEYADKMTEAAAEFARLRSAA